LVVGGGSVRATLETELVLAGVHLTVGGLADHVAFHTLRVSNLLDHESELAVSL
jgi:hypothetical protein